MKTIHSKFLLLFTIVGVLWCGIAKDYNGTCNLFAGVAMPPVISVTANGTYDIVHDWEVFKSVNPASQTSFAGGKKNFNWTVRVDETRRCEDYSVTGKITLVNPNPESAVTVTLSDVLDDGSVASIGPCTGGTWSNPNLTVPALGTAICDYAVTPKGNLTAFEAALPAQVTVKVYNPGSASYFDTIISGDGALNGTWEGWSVDTDSPIANDTNYTANVFSSTEALPAGLVEKPQNLDLVNWIINQNYVGKGSSGGWGIYASSDVQQAIWELIEDNPPNPGIGDANRVAEIKTAATANGEGFTPTCNDFIAVVIDPVGEVGAVIIPVMFADLGVNCAESSVATAVLNRVQFPASSSITWAPAEINQTATLDDDQKPDWPTTVSADTTFTYQDPQGYTCSTDPADYTNGTYIYNESNTATLIFGGGSKTATATTQVKCYLSPAVEIVKSGPLYATSGDAITYTFTVNNKSFSDSPNLMLDSVTDDVLGDLKAEALAAGCDNLVYNGTCTFTKSYTVPDVGFQAKNQKNVVTVHYHPAGFPNDISDTGTHTVAIVPPVQLTDSSLCPLPGNQFRLLYHLSMAPNIYRLQASNPGQFYYNAFYSGTPGSDFTMTLQVPYPFMTQEGAANPIQVHDGISMTVENCFAPNPVLDGYTITTQAMTPVSSAGNQIITPEDYTIKALGAYTTVTVSGTVPGTGLVYVTIHLDYGLKRTVEWKPTGTSTSNPETGTLMPDVRNFPISITIHGYEEYPFSSTVGGATLTTKPSGYNVLKKFAGFMGFVNNEVTNNPVKNVEVGIYGPTKALMTTIYTDEDGYYMYQYQHRAKVATYTIMLPDYGVSEAATVKAKGFAAVDFEVP